MRLAPGHGLFWPLALFAGLRGTRLVLADKRPSPPHQAASLGLLPRQNGRRTLHQRSRCPAQLESTPSILGGSLHGLRLIRLWFFACFFPLIWNAPFLDFIARH